MTRHVALALCVLLAACGGPSGPTPAPSGSDIILELGKSAPLGATGIRVRLLAVEDGRCRPDVVCIWEGNALIALELTDGSGPEIPAQLNTHPTFARSLIFRFVRIELKALDPLPLSSQQGVVYRAHLHWTYLPD